jgi:DNA-directed RNA polymerase II subunit RPB1|uniref:DNA-directed RNA polymerase n=1 Tax=viral metagenome TaxID=1070528 RepID=A0A6C0IUM0_9ZZZZ
MSLNSKYYSEDINSIERIDFSILTNTDVKKYSAVSKDPFGINIAESYDNYEPKKGGLVDLRLGTCDMYLPCTTCGLDSLECPGHFGHTELAEPVYHFGFMNYLKTILQCICLKCTNIIIDKDKDIIKKISSKREKYRLKELREITKNIKYCYHCGSPVPVVSREIKEQNASVRMKLEREVGAIIVDDQTGESNESKKKIIEYLSPRSCYNILRNISDEDCFVLGFNPKISRPEDFICIRFPIPPVIIRPTAKIDFMSSSTMEDSLTLKIADIISNNIRIRNQIDKETLGTDLTSYNQDIHTLLQYHISTYFDNDASSLPTAKFKASEKPIKSISERIKGKAGRIRTNLMGKRVDFSARSVITSDPYIGIDEVGVPKRVAIDLTIPEEVTPNNIKHLTKLVKNGKNIYPGANYVHRINYIDGKQINQKIDLTRRKKDIKLVYGDVVNRHIIDGDYVLFNRQPTLHKPSMMGHRIHVLDRDGVDTFRMNVSVTKPYNADFDGDEMNIHLAQSIQARNELARIANVKYNIISAKDSNPIIGCVQDPLVGAYVLTTATNKIDYNSVCNILCSTTSKSKYNIKKGASLNGHEFFSHIIPDGINAIKKKDGKISFQIKDGILLKGILDNASLSTKKNSIIHFIWDKFGPDKTRNFIDDTQRLILEYLMYQGLTIGFKDCLVDKEINKKLVTITDNKLLENKYYITRMENDSNNISLDIIENSMASELMAINANIGSILMSTLNNENNFYKCITSGSKGKPSNIFQMMGVMGQLLIVGSRVKKSVEHRTLPHFHRNDDTPIARGFLINNFVTGLNGHEFFFAAAAGREGLIDGAIKTAQTGYIQRRLVKALEDLSVRYDGTVRTANDTIIQYIYGQNGINQLTQTSVKINLINYNNEDIVKNLSFDSKQIKELETKLKVKNLDKFNKKFIATMTDFRDNLRRIYRVATLNYKTIQENFMIPVNLNRLTDDFQQDKINKFDLEPEYIIKKIDSIINNLNNKLIIYTKKDSKLFKDDELGFKYIFQISLYEYIAPVKCIYEYKLDKNTFDKLIDDIENNYIKSIVEPGEMVGIIAAQSVGEPTSQMSLDSKHSAGSVGGGALQGVPRIQEILGYSKLIKTPQMTIYFDKEISEDKNKVNRINSFFKYLTIGELIESSEIYYQVDVNNENDIFLQEDMVTNPFYINNQKVELNNIPFVFRLKMNLEKMLDKETTLLDIKTKFISYWYNTTMNTKTMKKVEKDIFSRINRMAILSSSDNNKEQIIHIRFSMSSFDYSTLSDFMKLILNNISLKGIDNIVDTTINQERNIIFKKDGNQQVIKEHVVVTSGINFNDLTTFKGIDHIRTRCNDTGMIYKLYGIEAARNTLIHQLVSTFSAAGATELNYNHMSLLVDFMTHTGDVTSIDRHGLGKLDIDPLSKASFEQTMDHFIKAAVFNEKDYLRSVSSKITVGQVIPGGTGAFGLVLDTNKLINSEYTVDETGGRTDFIGLESEPLLTDIIKYGINETNFFIPTSVY